VPKGISLTIRRTRELVVFTNVCPRLAVHIGRLHAKGSPPNGSVLVTFAVVENVAPVGKGTMIATRWERASGRRTDQAADSGILPAVAKRVFLVPRSSSACSYASINTA
jgi:hypothetical protein